MDMSMEEFFTALFDLEPGEAINVRAFHARSGRRGYHEFCASVEEACNYVRSLPQDFEIYFGVNPRINRDGSKTGVCWVNLLHADIDGKRFVTKQDAADAVIGHELEPTIVVDSGHGFHGYWLLDPPLNWTEHEAAETMMRRLYLSLGGLDATQDVSRVLRVPGTYNNKVPRDRREVKVVHQALHNRYTLDDFDAVLPALPVAIDHREVTEVVSDGEKPSLELLRELLSHIDPTIPQDQYHLIWSAIAFYYPDEDGERLVDEWSSDKRIANGQWCCPRTDPKKHYRYKRQTGRVTTLGTLIHHAKAGGYVVPASRQNRVTRGSSLVAGVRKHREDALMQRLDDLPDPAYDMLPHYIQLMYDHLDILTEPFPRDYTTIMALTYWSALWPRIKFENLGLNLWVMSCVEQGSGKNKITDALHKILTRVTEVQPQLYTSGTPEGMYRILQDDQETGAGGKQMFAYLREFGHWLATLKREHMAGATGVLCNLYDGAAIQHRLSKTEVIVTDPYVCFVGTTTPRAVVDNLSKQDLEGGFASRFWYLANEYHNEDSNYEPSEDAQRELATLIDQHIRDHAHIRFARFDCPEGSVPQAYLDFCRSVGIGTGEVRTFADALNDPKAPAGRHAARIKKVASDLELAERYPEVEGDTVIVRQSNLLLAILLVRRTMVHQEIVYTNISSSEDEKSMNAIQRVLERAGAEGLTRVRIMQLAHVKARELTELLKSLQEAGLAEAFDNAENLACWRSTVGGSDG